jgi:hypothetical protein
LRWRNTAAAAPGDSIDSTTGRRPAIAAGSACRPERFREPKAKVAMTDSSRREEIRRRINTIEESYEFFLAFAAQGVRDDRESPVGGQLREFLDKTTAALDGLAAEFAALVQSDGLMPADPYQRMVDVLANDAASALAAVELVRARPAISSQLVDNLNASIHVRALLTDLFLLDELLAP